MKIHLKEGPITPHRVFTPRLIPAHYQEEADKMVEQMLTHGLLKRVDEPTEWVSPGFFVPKPDKRRVRLVTDFVKLICLFVWKGVSL